MIYHHNDNSYVYFIQSEDGYIKIGKSRKPYERLKTLQNSNPHKLRIVLLIPDNSEKLEQKLHEKFKLYRYQNEWFLPSPVILQYIINHYQNAKEKDEEYIELENKIKNLEEEKKKLIKIIAKIDNKPKDNYIEYEKLFEIGDFLSWAFLQKATAEELLEKIRKSIILLKEGAFLKDKEYVSCVEYIGEMIFFWKDLNK